MCDDALLAMLACPETGQPLHRADDELLTRLNAAVAAGTLRNRLGESLDAPMEAALVRQDGAVAYPVVERIPRLLMDEAIAVDQLSRSAKT